MSPAREDLEKGKLQPAEDALRNIPPKDPAFPAAQYYLRIVSDKRMGEVRRSDAIQEYERRSGLIYPTDPPRLITE